MRKTVMMNNVSVDGYYAGPNGELHEWTVPDPAVNSAVHKMMHPDTLLMGRLTYQMFVSYWPNVLNDVNASEESRTLAIELNAMRKVVFSTTLNDVSWENTTLVKGDIAGTVRQLKRRNGPDITIFGSGTIVRQLVAEGLLDEYIFIVAPVILGTGKSLFHDVKQPKLSLLEAKKFKSGNLVLHYELAQ